MNQAFARSALALVFLGSLLASCFSSKGPDRALGECQTDFDCDQSDACTARRCAQQTCVEEHAPEGALATSGFTPPACHRFVCDGNGGEILEIDLSAKPMGSAGACRRLDCDAKGEPVEVIDTTAAPPEVSGDCQKETCDASGAVMSAPDVADEPQDEPGDCMKSTCDANGMATMIPADDPPVAACQTYTCQNGQAIGTPANQGASCSPHGLVCSAAGQCDTCPMPDAACTDKGPAAGSHSLAQAYNLGDIGWCDENGYPLCGALKTGVTAYFRYIGDGSGSFCQFDPYVRVQASGPVTLCEYFDCPSVECPAGATKSDLGGSPGCCTEGATPSMAIVPSCLDSDVHITVESKAPTCVSYLLDFHT